MLNFTNMFVFLSVICGAAIAAPYQELPHKPGYVPVYIREGNTPLSQINPKLVEAFKEDKDSSEPRYEQELLAEIEEARKIENGEATEHIKTIETTANGKQVKDSRDDNKEQQILNGEIDRHEQEVPASYIGHDVETLETDV